MTLTTDFNWHFHHRYYANLEFKIICKRLADFGSYSTFSRDATRLKRSTIQPGTDETRIFKSQGLTHYANFLIGYIRFTPVTPRHPEQYQDSVPLHSVT